MGYSGSVKEPKHKHIKKMAKWLQKLTVQLGSEINSEGKMVNGNII